MISLIDSAYVQARQAAGAGFTVKDEGSSLQTLATTLNFVGAGVTASGTGSQKTITISGGGGGGSSGVDSAATLAMIDSAYVQARVDGNFESKVTDVKYIATAGQTLFSGSGLDLGSNNFQVFVNGIKLLSSDFTANVGSNSITLAVAADLNDEVVVTTYRSNKLDQHFVTNPGTDQFIFVADSGQTAFTGVDANASTLSYNTNDFQVFLNGILLRTSDYTATSGTTLTLNQAADSADELSIISYNSKADQFGAGTGKLANFVYTATASQTVFTGADTNGSVLNYNTDNVVVFKQGVYLVKGIDYNTTNTNTITLTSGATVGDKVVIQDFSPSFAALPLTQIAPRFKDYKYIATSGQTVFSGNDQNGQALTLVSDNHAVFVNGIRLLPSDFTTNSTANSITLGFGAADSDEVIISTLVGSPSSYSQASIESIVDSDYVQARQIAGGGTVDSAAVLTIVNNQSTTDLTNNVNQFRFRADSGQTLFSGTDYYGNSLAFQDGNQLVYYNGSLVLETADYTTGVNSITFTSGVDSGDDVVIIEHQAKVRVGAAGSNAIDTFTFTATNGQTVFTGADNNSQTLSYSVGNTLVFLNGILLKETTDYTATNGSSVTLQTGANATDELTVQSVTQSSIGSNTKYQGIAGNVTLKAGEKVIVDTSVARTLTLPTTAEIGDEVRIIDGTGQAASNNITINRNGHKIQGQSTDLTINVARAALGLVYYNVANGWLLTEK